MRVVRRLDLGYKRLLRGGGGGGGGGGGEGEGGGATGRSLGEIESESKRERAVSLLVVSSKYHYIMISRR